MKVSVSTSILKSKNSIIKSSLDEFDTDIKNLSNMVNEMSINWNGSDYTQFKDKILSLVDELNSLKTSIKSYSGYIDCYVEAEEKLDDGYASTKISLK